jgi:hypothetical protein
MHPRTQIRIKGAEALRSKFTGVSVLESRRLPLSVGEFPCVLVYTDQEVSEIQNETPRITKNILDLAVEIGVANSGSLERELDDLCCNVESALSEMDLGNIGISRMALKATRMDASTQSENLIGIAKMTFEVIYLTEYSPSHLDREDSDPHHLELN